MLAVPFLRLAQCSKNKCQKPKSKTFRRFGRFRFRFRFLKPFVEASRRRASPVQTESLPGCHPPNHRAFGRSVRVQVRWAGTPGEDHTAGKAGCHEDYFNVRGIEIMGDETKSSLLT